MDILDDMGVSKLSAKVFSKVNYSFNLQGQSDHVLIQYSVLEAYLLQMFNNTDISESPLCSRIM